MPHQVTHDEQGDKGGGERLQGEVADEVQLHAADADNPTAPRAARNPELIMGLRP